MSLTRWCQEESRNALDQIVYIAETSGLAAVPVNRQRLSAQRLHDKVRDDAAVLRPHGRPIGVKDAHDPGVYPVVAMVRHGHRFGKALGLVVHAAGTDWIHVAPIVLRLRGDQGIAVDFRGAGQQKTGVLRHAKPKALWVPSAPTFK